MIGNLKITELNELTVILTGDVLPCVNNGQTKKITFDNFVKSISKSQLGLDQVQNVDTTTTYNINDSTNKRFVTDLQLATLATLAYPTTALVTEVANKRYVTDADLVSLANLSGVNTGDNAVNSLYSGLAASKQDTLISGTTIKTIGGVSLLGSGDISVGTGTVTGTGTTNELSYWTSSTAIGTLPVATYPSLTEISYVKGVTSGIQSQLNGKQASGSYQPLATVLTNTTASYTTTIDTRLANTSGTNTGDNATNSQYSGLASSKQDALSGTGFVKISGTTISYDNSTYITASSTNALTNKAITKRVVTTTDLASSVIDVTITDDYELTAVANATTFSTTGSATDGQTIFIRFKDAGVAKGLTWTGITALGVTLPTTTVASKWHIIGIKYFTSATAWKAIAVGVEA